MKISNMTTKTSLEISDNDIFIIEDNQDTKSVTAAELRDYFFRDKHVEKIVNDTLDRVAESILKAKYVIIKDQKFLMNTWIGSTSGNVQIALKDLKADKWLTIDELLELTMLLHDDVINTDEYVVSVMVNNILVRATNYSLRDFNEEHENPQDVNEILSVSNAGFIKAHFDGLSQNDIAGIKYNDVFVSINDKNDTHYTFIQDENSFANAVPFVEEV